MSTNETDIGGSLQDEALRQAAQGEQPRSDDEPETIEREIDATRADVHATLAALERRLSFERLMELTVGRIRERGGEFAGNLTDTAANNPMPVLLTSIGLAWMMLAGRRGNRAQDDGGAFAAARERATDAADSTRATVGDAADAVRAGASRMSAAARDRLSSAHDGMDRARQRVDTLMHEQPLILGALGLAAGALIGALLPATDTENQLVGERRDAALRNAARASRARYEAAREHAAVYSAPDGSDEMERPSRPH